MRRARRLMSERLGLTVDPTSLGGKAAINVPGNLCRRGQ